MIRRIPQFRFPTYPASALIVQWGANERDPIGGAGDTVPGDSYRLGHYAETAVLAICDGEAGQEIAETSEIGQPGDAVRLEACHSLMAEDGTLIDILMLSISGEEETTRHFLPLAPMQQAGEYQLLASEAESAPRRFADIACVSFLAGTHLSLAGGKQVPVEELSVGDKLMTRDHGSQEIRWIGQQTLRATGALAPIRIREGALNAARDLRLSPHHRLFIWQRDDALGTGRAELLVKAELLVNGESVTREEGGFEDCYQILFDGHEIIFAEGIAVESLLVTAQTRAALPEDLKVAPSDKDRFNAAEIELEGKSLSESDDPAAALTRASHGKPAD